MKGKKMNASIKRIIITVFIIAMLTSTGSIGYLVFMRWLSSAKQMVETISKDLSDNIYNQIYSFVYTPLHINEAIGKIIEKGILDLSDEKLREKFFAGILSSQNDEIYSLSYGTANGEYYGAHRNGNGIIEIMKNNADTGGNLWYYSVRDDLTAGSLVVDAGQFDTRTLTWYEAAQMAGGPTLSHAYKHFIMDGLAISASYPIYDNEGKLQGVVGTHMLLSDIGTFLEGTLHKYYGYAVIIEKDTGALIANSMGAENFTVLPDGELRRYHIDEIQNTNIQKAYEYYNVTRKPAFVYKGIDEKLFINIREINMEGSDWIVISAIRGKPYMENITKSIKFTVLLVILALLLSHIIYKIVISILLKPTNQLLKVSMALSSGDLSKRVEIFRNDEIGNISQNLNKVADKMQFLINNLEACVKERTEELHKTNAALVESKNRLQLILDSTAEAIYSIDLNGKCTFCNTSAVKLLGYKSPEELLGRNMHQLIHHSRRDGTELPVQECKIFQANMQGKGYKADDEVFWRADGTFFDAEYHAYPQIKDGKVVGAVITFLDITDRKKREDEIKHLSYHDPLTGLYNRRYLEDKCLKIDIPQNLPISVIFADINGLKMTNDIFGHSAGDELIKKSSEIIMQSCRESDIIARIGGDEFVILLPNTNRMKAEKVLSRIKGGFLNARVAAIKCSISLGMDTKTNIDKPLEEIISNAENAMYKDKTMNRQSINKDIIDTIVDTLHSKYPREKQHSIAVSKLCGEFGSVLHLSDLEINKLKQAGFLHDIGKITLDESILLKENLTEEEQEQMRQHSVAGYRILNLFDETLDLAEFVYSHHERWDGSGYPQGLKGEQIPLISRIISIVETYERVLNKKKIPKEKRKSAALKVIKNGAGKQFDPEITELFLQMMYDRKDESDDL